MKQSLVAAVTELLPVRPAAFAVLAALADGPRPGVEILDAINATGRGHRIFGPGTLYRLMRDLRRDGWISRTARADGITDERQAFHELTPRGTAILRAESARLRRLLELAGTAGAPGR